MKMHKKKGGGRKKESFRPCRALKEASSRGEGATGQARKLPKRTYGVKRRTAQEKKGFKAHPQTSHGDVICPTVRRYQGIGEIKERLSLLGEDR